MSLAAKFRKSLEEKSLIRFRTNHPDGDHVTGIVTANQRDFVVVREAYELSFDGILVLPKRTLTGYRDSKFERCANRIVRHAGEIRKARSPVWLNRCETLVDVLNEFQQRDVWPGVEIVWDGEEERESAFYVGPVVYVEEDLFGIHCYDGVGAWEDVYEIEFDDLFKITIEDSYTKHFNGYMREEGPERPL